MGKRKILIVEDEECIREYIGLVLKEKGFDVYPAANIDEAKKMTEKVLFTDFIVDLGLPDGLGFSLVDWLSQRYKFSEEDNLEGPSVVVISGNYDMVDLDVARQLNVKNVLVKPFSKDLLYDAFNVAA